MELRKDYILDRFVIISESRGQRPHEFVESEEKKEEACFFCPGNEAMTPPEIMRIPDGKGGWKIRVFPNKFAAAELKGNYGVRTDNRFFTFSDAYGVHEIIVETPDHEKHMADLSEAELRDVFKVYNRRIVDILRIPGIKYVSVFKNHGRDAGTSIIHTHTQIIANNILPTAVEEEINAIKRYPNCPYCDILNVEKGSYRRCFENDRFVAFAPYASRFHYEVWVFPKQHLKSSTLMDEETLLSLASIMKKILLKLKQISADYNFFLHYSEDDAYHFHIEVCPRLAVWAGFEYCTGITINSVSPEDAAKFYRGEE